MIFLLSMPGGMELFILMVIALIVLGPGIAIIKKWRKR